MKLKTKPNNEFKNTLLHNTEIPLHRIYSKTEENNTKIQNSSLNVNRFINNDIIDYTVFIMSKNEFIENFSNIKYEENTYKIFDNKYINNRISFITNNKNIKNNGLYMNKKNVSKIKIPAYLSKKYMKDNNLSLNKNIRYNYLNKDSSNLIITDYRLHCMFLDFIPEEYKDYYIIYCDSLNKTDILYLRTPCEKIEEVIDNYPNVYIDDLSTGTIKSITKYYDRFKEATFDLKTNEISNRKFINILTRQVNTKVCYRDKAQTGAGHITAFPGKYYDDEVIDVTSSNDPKYKNYYDAFYKSNCFI